jgi:hypothetical protein
MDKGKMTYKNVTTIESNNDLTDAENKKLNELIEPSSKTEEASLPKAEPAKRRTEFIKRDDLGLRRGGIINSK